MVFSRRVIMLALAGLIASCGPYPPVEPKPVPQQENWQHREDSGAQSRLPAPVLEDNVQEGALSTGPVQIVKVALLLPLTGRDAAVGRALQDAAVLALFDKYSAIPPASIRTRVELIPKDTKGDADQAALVTQEALKEGAQLILGPLFSESVRSAAPIARAAGVNMISFSNNRTVAGNNVFLFGFHPDEQVQRAAKYMTVRGVDEVAVLAPSTAYGQATVESLQAYANKQGMKVDPLIFYSPTSGLTLKEINTLSNAKREGRLAFDALFLPEGGPALRSIWNTLNSRDISTRTVQVVGTGLWDAPSARQNNNLTGAWYASAPPANYSRFLDRFLTTYEYEPTRIASLGYDAVALATTLAAASDGFSTARLTDPSGYAGPANGIFRFRSDGTIERGLSIIEIEGQNLKEIDSAPRSFVK